MNIANNVVQSARNVKKIFEECATVFPDVPDGTGVCQGDLQAFYFSSDDQREVALSGDRANKAAWTQEKSDLEGKVNANESVIYTSQLKIHSYHNRIAKEERTVNMKLDENGVHKKRINTLNLNIRDMTPGLDLMSGIDEHKTVLFSAPRMSGLDKLAGEFRVASSRELNNKIGNDEALAQNCVRSLFTAGAHLHGSHTRVITMSFGEIGQMSCADCKRLAAELLGFAAVNTRGDGFLAARVSRRRERHSNKRKRCMEEDEAEAPTSAKSQRTD